MTNFELFTLIFHALNQEWEECKDKTLGDFLSEINPYLWKAEMSADPAYFEEFKTFMNGKSISSDYGFKYAKEYLKTITYYPNLDKYLADYDEDSWINGAKQLLAFLHTDQSK